MCVDDTRAYTAATLAILAPKAALVVSFLLVVAATRKREGERDSLMDLRTSRRGRVCNRKAFVLIKRHFLSRPCIDMLKGLCGDVFRAG